MPNDEYLDDHLAALQGKYAHTWNLRHDDSDEDYEDDSDEDYADDPYEEDDRYKPKPIASSAMQFTANRPRARTSVSKTFPT